MPKTNEPGFLEQHLEKAVLAASVVAMILALSFWVVSSPREISLRTGKYPPEQVDQKLLEQAERLEQMLAEKPASMPSVPSYLDDLKARIFNPYPSELVRDYVQLQSGRQPLEPASAGGPSREKLELARLTDATIAPESPIAKAAREVLAVQQVDRMAATPADAEPKEVVAAHVAAVFEHGKLLSNWRPLLEKAYVQPTLLVLAVEAERRELLPDGSWSDPVPVSKRRCPATTGRTCRRCKRRWICLPGPRRTSSSRRIRTSTGRTAGPAPGEFTSPGRASATCWERPRPNRARPWSGRAARPASCPGRSPDRPGPEDRGLRGL